LLEYYEHIAPYILPYLKDRPLSLKRNPNGIQEEGFFHKDAGDIAPDWMKTKEIYSESTDKMINYLVCNDVESLLFIANLGCIEMNPWNSTIDEQDKPDYIVMDIDPSEQNTFDEVIDVALTIREILTEAGVEGYCKTSGSSGLHIYVPFGQKYTYEESKDFAHILATIVTERLPELTTIERSLSKRKKNQIYVDYLQNRRGQTLASAYSVRPKPGATVSAPLEWSEVKHGLKPGDFTIKNMMKRVKEKGDLFEGVLGKGIDIQKALSKLETIIHH
jgi:DNA ligase D